MSAGIDAAFDEPVKELPIYKLLTAEELSALPAPQWRVKGLIPQKGLVFVYGASGSGKTFLALDLAMAVALGETWFGIKTNAAPVVYMPLEAGAGIRLRVQAWEANKVKKAPDNFRVGHGGSFSLNESNNVGGLAKSVLAAVGSGAVVILDTLARATPDLDENSSRDMGLAVQFADELARLVDGLVLLVHHSGKDPGKGMRGSSSLLGAADATIEVTANNLGEHSWSATKVKDGPGMVKHQFALDRITLGQDEDCDDITSCVVRHDVAAEEAKKDEGRAWGRNQKRVLETITEELGQAAYGLPAVPAGVAAITYKRAETLAAAVLAEAGVDAKRLGERSRAALKSLVTAGVISSAGGGLTLPGKEKREEVLWLTADA